MNDQQPHGLNYGEIKRQCTAISKRSGARCKKAAMKGRTVCRAHGGATPRGIASPHLQHGRWSKDLPTQLARRYEAAVEDPDLLSLRDEIALVDTQISVLLAISDVASAPEPATGQALGRLVEQRRRLTETEVKHRMLVGQMVALKQVMALAGALAASVHAHVHDPVVIDAIGRDIERLLHDVAGPDGVAGGGDTQ